MTEAVTPRMPAVGDPAPDFSLPDDTGTMRHLADARGRWVVLFFYPKDDTPGCTLEGKNFTAAKPQYDAEQAVVVGMSEDDVASHKSFCDKFGFRIPLLADTKADAEKIWEHAQQHSQMCFIGQGNRRANQRDYIAQYWK